MILNLNIGTWLNQIRGELTHYHIQPAERANYLARCWQARRWTEGLQEFIYPYRYFLFRLRKEIRLHGRKEIRYVFEPDCSLLPSLTSNIPDLFISQVSLPEKIDAVDALFADVDQQLGGNFRLGGSYYQHVSNATLDSLVDDEHHHAYHRLYWAVRYAQASVLGHKQAEEALCHNLSNWLEYDWEQDRFLAYPYTTSERIASLAEILFWIRHGTLNRAISLIIPIKNRIWQDAIHLKQNIESGPPVTNHILNNARALYLASRILDELPESSEWRNLAFAIWENEFPQLVLEDGSFAEQSSHYHMLLARTALEYVLAAQQSARELPSGFLTQVRGMFDLLNDLLRDDGSLPCYGDISPDHTVADLWGLLASAYYYGLLTCLPHHKATTILTLYYCGREPSPSSIKDQEGSPCTLYNQGGWIFLQHNALNVQLSIHGDPRATTFCHGDSGRGSFELWWKGEVLIREPGNPAYYLKTRHWYRSGHGQNVSCLNGLAPGISFEDQQKLPEWYYACQNGEWVQEGNAVIYYANGFKRLHPSIRSYRKWFWNDDHQLVMREHISGDVKVNFESFLHLGDAPWHQIAKDHFECRTPTFQSIARMTLCPPSGAQVRIKQTSFAPEYGVELPGRTVVIKLPVKLPVEWGVIWDFVEPSGHKLTEH